RKAAEAPRPYLRRVLRDLAPDASGVVAMMTGASVERIAHSRVRRKSISVDSWCTAGCSNALRVGDRATVADARPGTINLIVAISQPLSDSAMVEAIQIAVEARVAAMAIADVRSTRSRQVATGTGTDCIVIAAPARGRAHTYCGKHTLIGELIGRSVLKSCALALRRSSSFATRKSRR